MLIEISASLPFIASLIYLIYKLRPLFPAYVSCWFCGEATSLPYGQRNSWECPKCDQYNGFNKDGNYNKPIPAQYDESYNRPIICEKAEFLGGHHLLCDRCSQNQLLKVRQLANFTPYNEKNYDTEVKAFSAHLEKVYRLCQQCEIRVHQELETQNEAICMRLSHLDESQRSLLGLTMNSTLDLPLLHSSYSDRRLNRVVLGSVVLHTVALVCALLLGAKEISLDGETDWQRRLLPLHPLFLWLDKTSHVLSVVGIFSGIAAKLLLGKYRLHILDAVSCPVWLLVLLTENSSLPVQQSYGPYKTAGLVTNILTCLACVVINRRRRNQSNMTLTRQILDNSLSDTASIISPLSSVSQVTLTPKASSHCQGQGSKGPWFTSEAPSLQDAVLDSAKRNTSVQEAIVSTSKNNKEDQKYPIHVKVKVEGHSETVDDTATELNAFSLGEPMTIKRNNSGLFSPVGSFCAADSTVSSNQFILDGLRARGMGQRRPLISPASFSHHSSVEKHRHSPVQHGLFSTPASSTQFSSHPINRSSSSGFSTFSSTNLFSIERHSFMPEHPVSPVITSFGRSPFANVPLQSDRLSQCSGHMSTKSFRVARQPGSVARVQSRGSALSDDSDDNLSDFTSVTNRCRVESTTASTTHGNEVPLWKHPGLVGFILGGSVVANILLGVQMLFNNNTGS